MSSILFNEVTEAAGISFVGGLSYGAAWGDLNGDAFPDLYVSNHQFPKTLYLNQGDGTFLNSTSDVFLQEEIARSNGKFFDFHGAAWADFDNDGDQDLLQTSNVLHNRLFVNDGGILRDQWEALGLPTDETYRRSTQAPTWLDYDGDGLLDFIFGNKVPGTIFRQTIGGFEDVTSTVAPSLKSKSSSGVLSDLNDDGSLELIIAGSSVPIFDTSSVPFKDITDTFLPTNIPTGNVTDVAIADFNGDLLPDIHLLRHPGVNGQGVGLNSSNSLRGQLNPSSSDERGIQFETTGDVTFEMIRNYSPEQIYIGASGFNPTSKPPFTLSPNDPDVEGIADHTPGTDEGIYIGYDSTQQRWQMLASGEWTRFIVKATEPISDLTGIGFNANPSPLSALLLINTGQGFIDQSNEAGINNIPHFGNSVVAGDYDNDMDVDLYILSTGNTFNQPNILYENQGDGTFIPVPEAGGAEGTDLGIGDVVVTADYDVDGFLDLFLTNAKMDYFPLTDDGPHQLFRNQGNENHWLQLDLEGTVSNRDAIGAKVYATAGGVTQLREQNGGTHRISQNHQRIHFGLADNTVVDELEVRWPSGIVQVHENISSDRLLQIKEGTGNNGNDTLNGSDRGDQLFGNGGNDNLNGNDGNDNLYGQFGNDVLTGDTGNDLLIGGKGNDTLTGGDGNDNFRFQAPSEGVDTLTDFSSAEDTIQVGASQFDWGDLVSGILSTEQFVLGTAAEDSSDRFIYDQSSGDLFFDEDGIGGSSQIQLATLSNQAALSSDDIAIV